MMNCSLCIITSPLLPPLPKLINSRVSPPELTLKPKQRVHSETQKNQQQQLQQLGCFSKSNLAIQVGTLLLATAAQQPAMAITGVNYQLDFTSVLIESGISAFIYFLLVPPLIMNWMRLRWYKRNLLEMYLQFMCVYIFFPGMMLWAPFLNVRKLPRDPNMKYPWSVPDDPSKIKNDYRRYPWATEEDYEVF